MTTPQVRLLASAIAMIAGAVASSTDNLNVNVGITIILVSGVLFLVEMVGSQRYNDNPGLLYGLPQPIRPCITFQIFSGVSGVSICCTPNPDRASITALATAAGAATVGSSPTPLIPKGFMGEGVS